MPPGLLDAPRQRGCIIRHHAKAAVRRRLADRIELGSGQLFGLEAMSARFQESARSFDSIRRFIMGIFALALGLAALGIYGLVAYTAETRRRELAIREALGASRRRVLSMMLRGAFIQAAAGVLAGAALGTLLVAHLKDYELKITTAAVPTAVAFIIVALTVLIASIGPIIAAWRRDLALVLRDA